LIISSLPPLPILMAVFMHRESAELFARTTFYSALAELLTKMLAPRRAKIREREREGGDSAGCDRADVCARERVF